MKQLIKLASVFGMAAVMATTVSVTVNADEVDSDWQEDYNYHIDEETGFMVLTGYIGTSTCVDIPEYAVIEGDEYTTFIDFGAPNGGTWTSFWGNEQTKLTSITIEDGVYTDDLYGAFKDCSSLTELNLGSMYLDDVWDLSLTFSGLKSLSVLDLSNLYIPHTTAMSGAFMDSNFERIIPGSIDTSEVYYMNAMFAGCERLSYIDTSWIETQNVVEMEDMFNGCTSLTYLDLSGFYTGKVRDMRYMFADCSSLWELDMSSFCMNDDIEVDVKTDYLLDGCKNLQVIITPEFASAGIELPYDETMEEGTWKDESGNIYVTLPGGSKEIRRGEFIDDRADGLCQDGIDGIWYLYDHGDICYDYSGLYYDETYGWWLIKNGIIDFSYNDLYCDSNLGWWKVNGGAVDFNYTDLYCSPTYGWWKVNGGAVDFGFTDLYCSPTYGWWKVNGGIVDFGYTDLYGSPMYGWWKVSGGIVDFGYTDLYCSPTYGWWKVSEGSVDFGYTDLYGSPTYGWWKVSGGSVDFGYSGIYESPSYGSWNISGGAVVF